MAENKWVSGVITPRSGVVSLLVAEIGAMLHLFQCHYIDMYRC